MNNWLIFAILSPAVYAVTNFIDKLILEKYIKDYAGLPIFSTIAALVFGTIIWLISGFPVLELKDALLVMLSGALLIWGTFFYFKALSEEETSLIIILFQTAPIMVFVLSWFFLKEVVTPKQIMGSLLVLTASIGVSINFSQKSFKFSKAFWLILLSNLIWSISSVIFKSVTETNSFSKLISFESWGLGLGGLIMYFFFPGVKKAFNKSLKNARKSALAFIFMNESLFIVAKLLGYYAIALGSVTLVTVLGSTQVFFGIIYGLILTLFAPKIFKEDTSKKSLMKKTIFSILTFCGIYLLS